jgi:hypothetical protein
LEQWPWIVITATHVIAAADKVTVESFDDAGRTMQIGAFSRARCLASPHQELALLRLSASLPLHRALRYRDASGDVACILQGYPASYVTSSPSEALRAAGANARHRDPWLLWNNAGAPGMSGAPVLDGDHVLGLYVGVGHGSNASTDHVAIAFNDAVSRALDELEAASVNPPVHC